MYAFPPRHDHAQTPPTSSNGAQIGTAHDPASRSSQAKSHRMFTGPFRARMSKSDHSGADFGVYPPQILPSTNSNHFPLTYVQRIEHQIVISHARASTSPVNVVNQHRTGLIIVRF